MGFVYQLAIVEGFSCKNGY